MPKLFGREYSREELIRHVGNISQIGGIREYTFNSGRADGVKALEVSTGRLRFTVVPSRCLDIAFASFRDFPFGYISKSGLRHPSYFSKTDAGGFVDNFFGGLLTTCGFGNIGGPQEYKGKHHGLHGELSNMPAEHLQAREAWRGDDLHFEISGEIHHSRFCGEDMILRRTISTRLGCSSIFIEDEVENLDLAPATCLLLYHINLGFPLLSAATKLLLPPGSEVRNRPGTAPEEVAKCRAFGEPVDGYAERCFYHTLKPHTDGMATACLYNPELTLKGMGVYVRYDVSTLPNLVQWKNMCSREYVCGLEPGSAPLENRDDETMAANTLRPFEKRRFRVEIGVVEGEKELAELGLE